MALRLIGMATLALSLALPASATQNVMAELDVIMYTLVKPANQKFNAAVPMASADRAQACISAKEATDMMRRAQARVEALKPSADFDIRTVGHLRDRLKVALPEWDGVTKQICDGTPAVPSDPHVRDLVAHIGPFLKAYSEDMAQAVSARQANDMTKACTKAADGIVQLDGLNAYISELKTGGTMTPSDVEDVKVLEGRVVSYRQAATEILSACPAKP